MKTKRDNRLKRSTRERYRLRKVAKVDRCRLSVFRSNLHIYAQIIDDAKGVTVASASSMDKAFKGKGWTQAGANEIGKMLGDRAKKAGILEVYFDRGAYPYHGRVKALAEGARESGLKF